MSEAAVAELAPGEIQRDVSTGAPPAAAVTEAQPASEMSAEQQAGVQKLAEMRERYKDPALDHAQRNRLVQHMNELAQHVFNAAARPAWYGEQKPDPRIDRKST